MNDVTTDSSPRALWVVREWLSSIWLANKPGLCHLRNTFWFSCTTSFSRSHCHFIYPEMETTVIGPLPSQPHWGKNTSGSCLLFQGWLNQNFFWNTGKSLVYSKTNCSLLSEFWCQVQEATNGGSLGQRKEDSGNRPVKEPVWLEMEFRVKSS